MKKLLILILASALLLASCGGKNNETTGNNTNTNDTAMNDTLGDDNGDGKVEEDKNNSMNEDDKNSGMNGNGGNGNENMTDDSAAGSTSGNAPAEDGVTSVASVDDAVTFIDVNVYSRCADQLPMSTMSTVLPLDDMDIVTYNTGLTDLKGVTDIIISESMIGSFAYSFVMVRTDGTNTDEIQTALGEQINPAKWVCVQADQIRSVRLDNDIILVMSDNGRTEPVMNAVLAAAEGVYENIGSVVNVLG